MFLCRQFSLIQNIQFIGVDMSEEIHPQTPNREGRRRKFTGPSVTYSSKSYEQVLTYEQDDNAE